MKDEYVTIYAVDFDGTLCESVWPGIGAPNLPLIEHLIERQNQGVKLILWTCRVGERLDEAVEWCRQFGLEFDAVNDNLPEMVEKYGNNCRKVYATVYIEDLAAEKSKYNIPFHLIPEKYTLGSKWWFRGNECVFPCHIEEYKKNANGKETLTVKSDAKSGEMQHYSVMREPEFFYDKLFRTSKEARDGEKEKQTHSV